MAAFATAAHLATYLRTATADEAAAGSPDILDTAVAEQALDAATGYIRGWCHWSITEETVTETYRLRSNVLDLPTLRLTAVTLVSLNGGPNLTVGRDYVWDRSGRVEFLAWTVWARTTGVTITYTHGWPEPPEEVRGVCLELAAQLYGNPARNLSEGAAGAGGVSTTFGRIVTDGDPRLARHLLMAGA